MAELSNKLNVRVQGVHNDKIINRIKHNIRHVKAHSQLNDNNNILIDIHSNQSLEFMSKKSSLSARMYKYFSSKYRTDRKEHNEKFKASQKRSVRDYHGSWAEGVLTFSEAIHRDLGTKYSQEDLIEAAKKMLLEFESEWETEVTFLCLHLSEKTPHFHFFFKNYNARGNSLVWKYRRRQYLSKLQDLMFKHFKDLGMERGIKKADSECGTVDYSKPKHEELIAEIETLKSEVKDLKLIRKSVTADVDKSKQEKKQIYSDITKVQKQKREEIKSLKEEAFKYSQKSLQIKQNYQNKLT